MLLNCNNFIQALIFGEMWTSVNRYNANEHFLSRFSNPMCFLNRVLRLYLVWPMLCYVTLTFDFISSYVVVTVNFINYISILKYMICVHCRLYIIFFLKNFICYILFTVCKFSPLFSNISSAINLTFDFFRTTFLLFLL